MSQAPITAVGKKLAPLIDHTLLKADARVEEVVQLCREARQYGFAAVCVHPCMVAAAVRALRGSDVATATVIGFPLGATLPAVKAYEATASVQQGAAELDMVLAVGRMKQGDADQVRDDILGVVGAARGRLVKVILETGLLTDEEKVRACRLAVEAGAGYVKTSTGFASGGATTHDVQLLRATVGPHIGVKASGGIRNARDATLMLEAGASRLGTSSGVAIVTGAA